MHPSQRRSDLLFTGNELEQVELPKLRNVDGNLSFWGNPNLSEVKLSQLVRIGGYLLIEANDRLARVDIPALASVNEHAVMHA